MAVAGAVGDVKEMVQCVDHDPCSVLRVEPEKLLTVAIIVQLRSATHEDESQGQHNARHELIGSRLVAIHPVLPILHLSDRMVQRL